MSYFVDTHKVSSVVRNYLHSCGADRLELSKRIGVSKHCLDSWVLRRRCPSLQNVKRLSEVIGVKTKHMLTGEISRLSSSMLSIDKLTEVYKNIKQVDSVRANVIIHNISHLVFNSFIQSNIKVSVTVNSNCIPNISFEHPALKLCHVNVADTAGHLTITLMNQGSPALLLHSSDAACKQIVEYVTKLCKTRIL
jgi:hypothetical protein